MASARTTLTKAFAHFGAKVVNPRWSWSALSADGKTVVLTLWEDQLEENGDGVKIEIATKESLPIWQRRLGNQERIRNLKLARDHLDGRFRVIKVEAKDQNAEPRSVAKWTPDDKLIMRLTQFCEETGLFSAESVER